MACEHEIGPEVDAAAAIEVGLAEMQCGRAGQYKKPASHDCLHRQSL
jgi:hypothetical protein